MLSVRSLKEVLRARFAPLSLAALAALAASVAPFGTARAATTLTSAQVSGVSSVVVLPSATITATLNVTNTGGSRWRSSGWRIATTPGAFTCFNTPQHNGNGSFTESFSITAPATAGTYNAYFVAYDNNNCGGTASNTVTLTGGVVVDANPPAVSSIVRTGATPTGASSVSWTVTFSESVVGVDSTDFALVSGGGVTGAAITSVTGSGTAYTVTASTGTGDGTLGLNLVDNDSITDGVSRPLGGTGAGNGNFTGQVYTIVKVTSFNAVNTGANATTGKLWTKIAGSDFALDLIALDASNAVSTSFTGTVAVEVVDNSGGGACSTLPAIATFTNQTFVSGDAGRHALTAGNSVGNVYRNALIRITYPAGSPTITSCSIDAFAIRPGSLGFGVTHANRTTEGAAPAIGNIAFTAGGELHNAGRPFRVTATAYRADGTTVTTNYDPTSYGGPTAALAACGGAACTASFGTLSLGTWSASGGVVTTTTASYDEVGAFSLQLQDATFAVVDSTDGSSYIIPSAAAVNVGRFVPDRFVVSNASIVPRSDIAACSTSGFTYMDEPMSAKFTLTAVNAAGNPTTLYAGAHGRLGLTTAASLGFGAIDGGAPTPLTSRVDSSMAPANPPTWVAGVTKDATLNTIIEWRIAVSRPVYPALRDGPYDSLKVGIAPSDPDSVTLGASALNLDADNDTVAERAQIGATTAVRFGRLRVLDVSGSGKASLPLRMRAEYWNGTMFVVNALDSCTPLDRRNVAMTFQGLGACATALTTTPVTFSSGVASAMLSAPNAGGTVDLRVNLSASSGNACNPASTSATNASLPYLQEHWTSAGTYSDDPAARATFGVYGQDRLPNNVIFRRENF